MFKLTSQEKINAPTDNQSLKGTGGALGATEPNEHSPNAGRTYGFKHLSMPVVLRDMYFNQDDPGPGDRVPDFDLPTLAGGRFRSADLAETGPAILIFGSYTCPVTDSAAPGLNQLYARFGDRVRFVMVNVREAHPGKNVPQPQSMDQKMANAVKLRDLHDFDFEVAVDDIDGTFHRALSPKPNSAYIVAEDGTILFRAQWANDTKALAEALEAITAGKALSRLQSRNLVRPMLKMLPYGVRVFDRSGKGAWLDMWRAAPPVAFLGFLFKTLGVGPKSTGTKS